MNYLLAFIMTINVINVFLVIRNDRVYRIRMKAISQCHDWGLAKIREELYSEAREAYQGLEKVSYQKMWLCFWKPVDSFWSDLVPQYKEREHEDSIY